LDILLKQLRDVSLSVLPITLLVIILNFTIIPLESQMFIRFLIGAFLVIIGLGIFLFGTHLGITPIGNLMGETIAKTSIIRFIVLYLLFRIETHGSKLLYAI
jgi:vacuolar-type H+-ATPase subunit I/STV1